MRWRRERIRLGRLENCPAGAVVTVVRDATLHPEWTRRPDGPGGAPQPTRRPSALPAGGRLLEACSCNGLCPCWVGDDPDYGACYSMNVYHYDRGEIDGVDVSGLSLALVCRYPGNVLKGDWQVAAFVDAQATPAQKAESAAHTGELGGPLADLASSSVRSWASTTCRSRSTSAKARGRSASGTLRGRDPALHRRPGPADQAGGHGLQHHPRLAGLRRQGDRVPGQRPAARHGLGVRRAQRHPRRLPPGGLRRPHPVPAPRSVEVRR